jgi:hypothetical protein
MKYNEKYNDDIVTILYCSHYYVLLFSYEKIFKHKCGM